MNETSKNYILVDADYIDKVAFDLTVNFERMLGRPIPQADMARWVECLALDSGLRPGDHQTTVVLVHDRETQEMHQFAPGRFAEELDGKAFSGELGEFSFSTPTGEGFASKEELLADAVGMALQQSEVTRILIVPDEQHQDGVRARLRQVPDEKRVMLFTMNPTGGGQFMQEMLGYSLMAALGIGSREIDEKLRQQNR